jgi:hypothetical protein
MVADAGEVASLYSEESYCLPLVTDADVVTDDHLTTVHASDKIFLVISLNPTRKFVNLVIVQKKHEVRG